METVVSLLGQRSIVFKIFKPCVDVDLREIASGVEAALSGHPMPKHMTGVMQQQ